MKNSCYLLFSLLFFALANSEVNAQTIADQFSVRIGAGIMNARGSAVLIAGGVHVEPRLQLRRNISLGLRYDVGVLGFGDQRISQSSDNYRITDVDLSLIRSGGLLGYFHFKVLQADFQAGMGLQYTRTVDRVIREYYKPSNSLIDVYETEGHNNWGPAFAFSVNIGAMFFTTKLATYKWGPDTGITDNYVDLSFGYRLLDEQTGWRETPFAESIPSVFLEFGMQTLLPIIGDANAAAFGAFVEPKIAINEKSSIGFKFEFDRAKNKGYDTDLETFEN